ncbi:hypothetical protein CAOG_01864 [Capsaspora owczarzaki ATCC 30864]|uniref:Inositol polyphosphate-related phosphatase domain-containing protein n=1 Tax=Capsaspora owczarzaki (strain ATCC 30864) TaxID=595528 RepID=A0A0D2X1C4_CAPO3|nr:hypothetical protein CAOG_01864 [Capsaspora owczarzaki ATCC 30864]KJE90564.1 hypothetical protein CAOG_001864 [Capsaspora owczarzaki ATCC 30864]|eukprot:XP_004364732.1 hypothetical protein CAOG_01864 [Capsaspora owczarzaki ATCC 30864]
MSDAAGSSSPRTAKRSLFQSLNKSLFTRSAKRSDQLSDPDSAPVKQSISVLVGSWNVGNTPPPSSMASWLRPTDNHDVIAVGVQECQYDPRPEYESCEDDWFGSVAKTLGDRYTSVANISITPMTVDTYKSEQSFLDAVRDGKARSGEIRLSVHVRKEHLPLISNVEKSLRTTGRLGGLSGNKGGLCASFKFGETQLCFVNCHLNAHDENYERRNADARAINAGIKNGIDGFGATTQYPYVFWFGDLNYRVEAPLEEVKAMLAAKNYAAMLERDQLAKSKQSRQGFYNYREAPITFAPTFKFKKNKEEYDFGRITSYCDRVLYKTLPGLELAEGLYDGAFDIHTSDHVPVMSCFRLDIVAPFTPLNTTHVLHLGDLRTEDLAIPENSAPDAQALLHACFNFAHATLVTDDTGAERMPNPKWKDKISLKVKGFSFEYLRDCHILVSAREEGKSRSSLGEAAISLSEACDSEKATFAVDLVLHGVPKARLLGTVWIE